MLFTADPRNLDNARPPLGGSVFGAEKSVAIVSAIICPPRSVRCTHKPHCCNAVRTNPIALHAPMTDRCLDARVAQYGQPSAVLSLLQTPIFAVCFVLSRIPLSAPKCALALEGGAQRAVHPSAVAVPLARQRKKASLFCALNVVQNARRTPGSRGSPPSL
jgi:hypothetical protein